jgi:hypothetical protein
MPGGKATNDRSTPISKPARPQYRRPRPHSSVSIEPTMQTNLRGALRLSRRRTAGKGLPQPRKAPPWMQTLPRLPREPQDHHRGLPAILGAQNPPPFPARPRCVPRGPPSTVAGVAQTSVFEVCGLTPLAGAVFWRRVAVASSASLGSVRFRHDAPTQAAPRQPALGGRRQAKLWGRLAIRHRASRMTAREGGHPATGHTKQVSLQRQANSASFFPIQPASKLCV